MLEREFRRVPRIVDVTSFGGTVKRYEIHPDPDRMKQFGITLGQIQTALTNANLNVGGDYVIQGPVAMNVRAVGLFGAGRDPVGVVLGMDKQALDAYQDACLAEALHVITAEQREAVWQLLAERKIAAAGGEGQAADRGEVGSARRNWSGWPGSSSGFGSPRRGDSRSAAQRGASNSRSRAARLRAAGVPRGEDKQEAGTLGAARRWAAGRRGLRSARTSRGWWIGPGASWPATRPARSSRPSASRSRPTSALRRWAAERASAKLRQEEGDRIREIRSIVLTSINNREILLEDVVEGGRLAAGERAGDKGVVVGHQTRLGRVSQAKPQTVQTADGIYRVVDAQGKLVWRDEQDKVQCIVLLRKDEDSLPALKDVEEKVEELNDPASGKLLPGVTIEPYYDRTDLINVTTETVQREPARWAWCWCR